MLTRDLPVGSPFQKYCRNWHWNLAAGVANAPGRKLEVAFVSAWSLNCVLLCDSIDCSLQALLSMKFSKQEYWSGLPFPTPNYLPNPGVKPASPVSPALAGRFFTTEPPWKPQRWLGEGLCWSHQCSGLEPLGWWYPWASGFCHGFEPSSMCLFLCVGLYFGSR